MDDSALLRAVMEAAVDAIVVSDAAGRILRANRAAAGLFGYEDGDMVGRNVRALMPPEVAEAHERYIHARLDTGQLARAGAMRDVVGRRADGSAVPVSISVGRAETEDGAVFVAILHDLSARRALEVATARSQKMDAIGRMTAGIAHDFNNLLTVVIGNLELLEAADLSDRHRGMLRDALASAELGADVTARLTAFARNSELKPTRVDLADEVERSVRLLRHTIGSHCRIETDLQPGLWPVDLDASRLQTALLNLAINAQDAMSGGGLLSIEAQNADLDDSYVAQELGVAPGHYVRLSVADTGHGMSAEARDRALEPFFTTKPAGQGTGLGLPVVYGFVKQSGGHLSIYSEPGRGTVVSLYFPAAEGAERRTAVTAAAASGRRPLGAGRTILIVEDDEKLRRLTKDRLSALGFACLTAETADAAWALLQTEPDVSAVFADMVMPGTLSGYDLARRLAEERPEIAVLLTSGFSETVLRDREVGDEFGMLRKPYRQEELENAIAALLGAR